MCLSLIRFATMTELSERLNLLITLISCQLTSTVFSEYFSRDSACGWMTGTCFNRGKMAVSLGTPRQRANAAQAVRRDLERPLTPCSIVRRHQGICIEEPVTTNLMCDLLCSCILSLELCQNLLRSLGCIDHFLLCILSLSVVTQQMTERKNSLT